MIRVLLADDHAVVRDGLRALLEQERDIEVVGTAATGLEIVDLATELRPDVVVMDVAMPDLDGIVATRRIRSELPEIRVVVLSMHATSEHLHHALEAGAVGYVVKSSAGAEVTEAVRAAARDRSYLSESLALMQADRGTAGRSTRTESPLESLSPREREVLQMVVGGRSSAEIAGTLNLAPGTVDTYRSRIMRKLGVEDLVGLVRFAVEHGLTPP